VITHSTIPEILTIDLFCEFREVIPACRGRVANRCPPTVAVTVCIWLGETVTGSILLGLAGPGSAGVAVTSRGRGKVGVALGNSTTKELLGVPKDVVLVISCHPAEAQLLIPGHGATNLLVGRHVAVPGLRFLDGFKSRTEERVRALDLWI
jgi:hypothetical protein